MFGRLFSNLNASYSKAMSAFALLAVCTNAHAVSLKANSTLQRKAAAEVNSHVDDEFKLEPNSWDFEESNVEVILAPPSKWPFDIIQKQSSLPPQVDVLRKRLQATIVNPEYADPLVIRLKSADVRKLVRQLGNNKALEAISVPTKAKQFLENLTARLRPRVKDMRLTLVAEDLFWLDLEKLSKTVSLITTQPYLRREQWARLSAKGDTASSHASEHLGSRLRSVSKAIQSWLSANPGDENIPLSLFLPQYLQESLGQYFPYKGRNCFATALSFVDRSVVTRPHINPIREPAHDRGMINSDEFAQALWLGYYELDSQEILAGLQLGDMVVFYDDDGENSYRSLRHAAVHIADTVYFHKQSKSATTPIEFVDWSKLVSTWSSLAKKLDYKVYRKLPIGLARYQRPGQALEKIYWSE